MCGLCNKGFNVKSNLLRHLRTLHDQLISPSGVEDAEEEEVTPGPSEVKRESWGRGGGAGRGRGRRAYGATSDANRRAAAEKKRQTDNASPSNVPRKQSYSLFLKQRAVLFSAKKWKQWNLAWRLATLSFIILSCFFRLLLSFKLQVATSPAICSFTFTPAHPPPKLRLIYI